VSAQEFKAPASVDRLQGRHVCRRRCRAYGVYGLTKSPADFYHSLHFSYMRFWVDRWLLGLLMLQHLTGGIWGMSSGAHWKRLRGICG